MKKFIVSSLVLASVLSTSFASTPFATTAKSLSSVTATDFDDLTQFNRGKSEAFSDISKYFQSHLTFTNEEKATDWKNAQRVAELQRELFKSKGIFSAVQYFDGRATAYAEAIALISVANTVLPSVVSPSESSEK